MKPPKRYLRKAQMAERYGCTPRSIDRMCADGRIIKPIYLPGSHIPLWNEAEQDAADKRATVERVPPIKQASAA
jgi:hypothetical protein